MSVKEVTALRKSGHLVEAYNQALSELREEDNEWTEMSLFWVLRDLCKEDIDRNNLQKAEERLSQMEKLLPNMLDDNGAGQKAYDYLIRQVQPNAGIIVQLSELSKTNATDAYNQAVAQFGNRGENLSSKLHEDFAWIVYRYMKGNLGTLSSYQVRVLLNDYMQLNNPRPSMAHSMILNFALNFSKEHFDFKFYNFLKLWGFSNLSYDDFHNSYSVEGNTIPSLVSRIMRIFVETQQEVDWKEFFVSLESNPSCVSHKELVDQLRQPSFWNLMNLQKEGKWDALWSSFTSYAKDFSDFGPSHWHSEILKIANRFMSEENSWRFISFIKLWDINNLRDEDWEKEKGKDDKEYPSLAVKSAKKCFEVMKADLKSEQVRVNLLWLKEFYKSVIEHDRDEWNLRNFATICIWLQQYDEAAALYKDLIVELSDKYYVWSELAKCIVDNDELKIGLLLKAKSIERDENFLGDIHLDLAEIFVKFNMRDAANDELKCYAENRQKMGWSLSDRFRSISNSLSSVVESPKSLDLNNCIRTAENFAFDKYEWTNFVLTEKWKKDNVEHCNFTNGEDLTFSIKTKRFPVCFHVQAGEVVKFRCKIDETQKTVYVPNSWITKPIVEKSVTPLVAARTELQPWSILPIKYGIADYDNVEKKTMHVLTQDSKLAFYRYNSTDIKKGDFISFREYSEQKKDEVVYNVVDVSRCDRNEALPNFKSRIVVVDDVNEQKKLFHVVLGPNLISDIVRYEETNIRPSIGDFLKIIYIVKTNKEGKEHIKFLDIQNTTEGCNGVRETVTGKLEVKYKYESWRDEDDEDNALPDFAFVKDFYVHRKLLRKYNITKDCDVIAKVVLGGDNKWKVYDLEIKANEVAV